MEASPRGENVNKSKIQCTYTNTVGDGTMTTEQVLIYFFVFTCSIYQEKKQRTFLLYCAFCTVSQGLVIDCMMFHYCLSYFNFLLMVFRRRPRPQAGDAPGADQPRHRAGVHHEVGDVINVLRIRNDIDNYFCQPLGQMDP